MAIEHTTTKIYYKDNKPHTYSIYPDKGYRLHVKALDEAIIDKETLEPTGEVEKGYREYPGYTTVGYNYDFEKNPQELFAEEMR